MIANNWQDESLCYAISRNARIKDYSFFEKWKTRFKIATVGDAIRYGRQNLLNLKGFGKAYDKSLLEFIKSKDMDLFTRFRNNETSEYYANESFSYN